MNTERDRIVCQLLDPRDGTEMMVCYMDDMPAAVLEIVRLIGQAPRVVVVDAQKMEI